jgi:hypothetical protein
MKIEIAPSIIKSALNTIKILKPIFNDYSLYIRSGCLSFSSFDKRRSVVVSVPVGNAEDHGDEEFFIPMDRSSIFDADLGSLSLSINDKGLNIKHHGNGVTKSALLKRRSSSSKRPPSPKIPNISSSVFINKKDLEDILKGASCSALVKETHTEEDMKVNQIHFYSDHKSVSSNARFYASCVFNANIDFNASIVSSDIPLIRSFISRCGEKVKISNVDNNLYILDEDDLSSLLISGVSIKKPDFLNPNVDAFANEIIISYDSWKEALKWAVLTLEGTQRIRVTVTEKDGVDEIQLSSGDTLLSSFPVTNIKAAFSADFPLKVLTSISEYLSESDVRLLFGITKMPEVLVIEQNINNTKSQHFVRSMKSK